MNAGTPLAVFGIVACAILVIIMVSRPKTRVQKIFLAYVSVLLLLSTLALVERISLFSAQADGLHRGLLVAGTAAAALYYHFIRAFLKMPAGPGTYVGYAGLAGVAIYVGLGGVAGGSYIIDGNRYYEHEAGMYVLAFFSAAFFGMAAFYLVNGLGRARDASSRNLIGYLVLGVSILPLLAGINFVPAVQRYYLGGLGNTLNALVVGYALLRRQPLDIMLGIRTVLVYLAVFASIGGVFAGLMYLYFESFPDQPFQTVAVFLSGAALLLALATRPLRLAVQRRVESLSYRETHRYREAMLDFAARMGNVLNLDELAGEILPTMSKAIQAGHASLLVEDDGGNYSARFAYPKAEKDRTARLSLSSDSLVVLLLDREGVPLETEGLDSDARFQQLPRAEKESIKESNLDILCPIKSRNRLVGILAFGKKQSGSVYTYRDVQLMTRITGQIGVMIENARLYSQALSWALTDGLIGLYNHRHFHKVLEQEIARCSRYNAVLSLVMLDVDRFKAYNDTFGHPAGDKLLRGLGDCMAASIRGTDTAFRYGGEEFAVVLPETGLENACTVAERIREMVQQKLSSGAMSVTVSLGVATSPVDGVTKEQLIGRADAALYLAKQTGRNRVCKSSDLGRSVPASGIEIAIEARTLNTVYALAAAVDAKDHYTYGHSTKVSDYSIQLAVELGLAPGEIAAVRAAGLLHDVGKIGILDSILKKDGPLTDREMEEIKTHPRRGVDIVKQVSELNDCLPAILHHHERPDGTGYPSGVQGDSIPVHARILAIADAYDALTSARHYREWQMSRREALDELRRFAGTQFDAALVDMFSKVASRLG